jgi:hypothetical protein
MRRLQASTDVCPCTTAAVTHLVTRLSLQLCVPRRLRAGRALLDTGSGFDPLVLWLHVKVVDRQMKRLCALVLAVAGTWAAFACSSPRYSPQAPLRSASGTVRGVLLFGGPGPIKPVPGQVTASDRLGRTDIEHVGSDGRFFMTVAVGTYEFTGSSPRVRLNGAEVKCSARQLVRVRAHETVRDIKVLCTLI